MGRMRIVIKKGFTLIELLIVIAIIGVLAVSLLPSILSGPASARNVVRLNDIRKIQTGLEAYKMQYGVYPPNTDNDDGAGGWDLGYSGGAGASDTFIDPLRTLGIMSSVPKDPNGTGASNAYYYYLYPASYASCPASRGDFYVLGIKDFETLSGVHPSSPGFSCPGRDWGLEFPQGYVTGDYTY